MQTLLIFWCFIMGCVVVLPFSLQAQTHLVIQSSICDSSGTSLPTTMYISRARVGGFFLPDAGTIDSTVSTNGILHYTITRPDAYYVSLRAGNFFCLDIPLIIENQQSDSIVLRLKADKTGYVLDCSPSHEYIADMTTIHKRYAEEFHKAYSNFITYQEKRLQVPSYNDSTLRVYLSGIMLNPEKHHHTRRFAAYHLSYPLHSGRYRAELLSIYNKEILSILPYTSYQWSWGGQNALVGSVMTDTTEHRFEMLMALLRNNPDVSIRRDALLNLLSSAKFYNRDSLLNGYCEEFQERFLHHPELQESQEFFQGLFLQYCGKNNTIAVGKQIPDFSFSLWGRTSKVTKKTMLGKVYLIDFWGTWCGGCVREVPVLEKLYQQYKNKGFTIISCSHEDLQTITHFRKKRYAMPWFHVKATKKQWKHYEKTFDVFRSYPHPILVGADGTIFAHRYDAMGKKLEAALAKVLKNE